MLTQAEKRKAEILQLLLAGKLSSEQAAKLLQRSERSVYRLLLRVEKEGIEAVIHGNRGKPSHNRLPEEIQVKIISLVADKYQGVNDTHLSELLLKHEKIRIGRETLRSLLRKAGIRSKRRRRKPKYRSRRERKEAMGIMLQMDGSPHDWLEGRGPWLTMIGAKDDATGFVWTKFFEAETTWAYLELMEMVFLSHGLPLSLYSDRHTIFHIAREQTITEQLKGIHPLTQFGRAMDALGIRLIKAWSPQAKGRIERQWGVFQDRLVVELRLAGARNQEEANEVLKTFLPEYNRHFLVQPKQVASVFRVAPSQDKLDRILCLRDERVVNNDHTISFEGLTLQIPPSKFFHSLAKERVEVLQLKDGCIEIYCKKHVVAHFSPPAVTRLVNAYLPQKTELKLVASN